MLYKRRFLFLLALLLCLFSISACSNSSYLVQCVKGQWDLMSRAKPIEDILAQGTESQPVRDQLAKVMRMREFAVNSLHLPDSGSYRQYADLERPYVVWNLVAAPELSLDLKQWCFPVAGCVTYRGYFDETAARTMANTLHAQGFDVDVYGVRAYSTLNWFDDPVLNTFLTSDDAHLAALLFHEMSHQVIYVQNDTAFNESFAKTVEMEGLRRWLQVSDSPDLWQQYLQREEQFADFRRLLGVLRADLRLIYLSERDDNQKRLAKEQRLAQTSADYEQFKQRWGGYGGFDAWIKAGINNARLSSMATYHGLVPAFQTLLQQADYDLTEFYVKVKALGALTKSDRLAQLKSLSPGLQASLQ